MGNRIIWIIFIVAFQSTAVLGRNQYHDYFYSRYHHKSHSTTTAISSTVSEYFSEVKTESSVSDDSIENIKYSSTDDFSIENVNLSSTAGFVPSHQRNGTVHSYGDRHRPHHKFFSRTLLVVGSIITFLCIVGLTVCCCPKYCRGVKQSGYGRTEAETAEEQPQQPVLVPYPQQQVIIHACLPQYPGDCIQHHLPEYQPQLVLPQRQHFASQSPFYNFPEAPPPYEPPKY